MATELTTTEKKTLATLGKNATREHLACLKLGNESLSHASLCGAYLQQAKDSLAHGQWLKWLETDFSEGCESTAQGYMKIARNWSKLQQIPSTVADLSIRGALKALAKPREPDPLAILPPEQRAGCEADYQEECNQAGEEPTAEGLEAAAGAWAADNVPYDGDGNALCPRCGGLDMNEDGTCAHCVSYIEPPDAPSDAPESDPTETPAAPPDAPMPPPRSPCEVFWEILEMQIDKFVAGHGKDAVTLAAKLENKANTIRSEQ